MTKYTTIPVVGIRIKTFLVLLAQQRQKIINIIFVNECPVILCTEELSKVESLFIFGIIIHQRSEVVGVDIDGRKRSIRIRVAHVQQVPFCFGALLHGVIPCVRFLFCVIIKQIEWRP